jgi:diguanylate cyclase (GGDEF)-like protein
MVAVTVQSSELFLIYMMMSVMVVYTAIMFLPLELRHATALAVMTLIPVTYFVLIAQLQSSAEKLQLLVFLSGVMAALLQARRIQNIYAHRVFLLQKRDELRTNEVNRLNEQLAGMAYMDRLTDIPNRRFFEEKAEAMMAAPCEYQPLALCLMDIDHFKNLNDRLGHQQGDRCLQMVASTLREHLRAKSDILARYGGEEFVLLLPATNSAAATQLLDRLRLAVRDLHLPNPGTANGSITISAGLAMSDGGAFDMEELLKQADAALYRAKSAGRNQVCV